MGFKSEWKKNGKQYFTKVKKNMAAVYDTYFFSKLNVIQLVYIYFKSYVDLLNKIHYAVKGSSMVMLFNTNCPIHLCLHALFC